ncbi:hypothetical protein [Solitalea koreensis]|uniref:Phosphoribosylpyrophosphate synthetase n=1 Tax=Solitalea koreensis TaxID=543615 RepID=A0A521DL23_9SPHI|nr:hypothetical protein [Solitalea koreensis]SMO72295.1 hypothetical protein SAMN06265350_10799 [Solitalea koreensis]
MKFVKPIEKVYMESLVTILESLNATGFETQFKATSYGLLSLATQKTFQPNEVKVLHFYRFEGESNPDDSSILYAIETKNGEKGTLVDGYGVFSDSQVSNFMIKVEEIHK